MEKDISSGCRTVLIHYNPCQFLLKQPTASWQPMTGNMFHRTDAKHLKIQLLIGIEHVKARSLSSSHPGLGQYMSSVS